MLLSINDFYVRFQYDFDKDFEFLSNFFHGFSSNLELKENMNNLFQEYFNNKFYNNQLTDILVNTCSKYFGFKLVIVEERDKLNTHLISLPYSDHIINNNNKYQLYCGETIVLLRTVIMTNDNQLLSSHYDLLLPKDMDLIFKIDYDNSILKISSNSENLFTKID